ncbi:MAG: kynureninase [Bacteroidota bacterium]
MTYQNSLDFALQCDGNDALKDFRTQFHIPAVNSTEALYFTGNSLGLQPKQTAALVQQELIDWQNLGVEGHFHAKNPWYSYHNFLTDSLTRIVGALPQEVVAMNTLSVNLHLLMVSFYRPTKERFKIIIEGGAFPSDRYAVESQVRFHGFLPENSVIEIEPRPGEYNLRTEDIYDIINQHGSSVALVLFSGVQYYTGQRFKMREITEAAHNVGAYAGFDLAHAVGNVELSLHDWNVDFAAWCSYKYLNSGPGGVGGIFVHEKYAHDTSLPRFAGWWGTNEKTRFAMERNFIPAQGAAGWQLSNAPVLPMAAHRAALNIFDEAGMEAISFKRNALTGYLEFLLKEIIAEIPESSIEIITPSNPEERGAQLSLLIYHNGRALFDALTRNGVIADWREPNVIRLAPAPLYNTFEEVFTLCSVLKEECARLWAASPDNKS